MIINEAEIRENIAAHLSLFDPDLKLVAQEHYIKMPEGRKAYIDILAKDEYGCFTIIEIKKSNQTARSAVQQMYKYASFLKKKNRLESSQIRCWIMSTVWDELKEPFSEFSHFSEYESKGYEISYHRGKAPTFVEVTTSFETGDINPLKNFIFFEFKTPELRDNTFCSLKKLLKAIPSLNSVTIKVNHESPSDSIINPYGFAWVVFTGDFQRAKSELSKLNMQTTNEKSFDPGFCTGMWELDDEESILRTQLLTKHIKIRFGEGEYNGQALHSLNNVLNKWKYFEPEGHGTMFDDGLFDSNDLISMSCGFLGWHPYNFVAKTGPRRPKHFHMVRQRINDFLETNQNWKRQVNVILSSLDEDDVVQIRVFNPLNFFGFLNDIYTYGSSKRIPSLEIMQTKNDSSQIYWYGGLFWTKKIPKIIAKEAIENSYPSLEFFKIRAVNQNLNQYDEKLSSACGLTYETTKIESGKTLILSFDGSVHRLKPSDKIYTLQDFINKNDSLVDEVGNLFSSFLVDSGVVL